MSDKCVVCEKNERHNPFSSICQECTDSWNAYTGEWHSPIDNLREWAAKRAREKQQAEIDRLKELIYQAALASETVDHWDGTRELRREAGLKTE